LITTLVDRTTDIFDKNFLELNIDESNLELLKNDSFKNALFYESLKRETVDNYCYLYLLITSNFFSKYNFISYENSKSLEAVLIEYLNFKYDKLHSSNTSFTNLDKLLLQIASPNYSKTMEIDHIFPLNGIKISKKKDRFLSLNHIGNFCYLSKLNNQKKSNTLPNDYIAKLFRENNSKFLREFKKQTYWPELLNEEFDGNIKTIDDFKRFLNLRMKKLIVKIIMELEVS
jgi:hypothetical protein